MQNSLNLIKSTTLLKHLSDEEIFGHLKSGDFKTAFYKEDMLIHYEGEPCDNLEIVFSGKVSVERVDESGNLLIISNFYKDDIIGGNLIFSKHPFYSMNIIAKLKTEIIAIDKEALFDLFCNYPKILRTYLELVSDNASLLGDKIKHYINKTIRESIMNFLKHESTIQKSNTVKLNMTKKSLAEKIGVQRTSLSRELNKMSKDGIISFDKDTITILKD